MIVFFFFEKLGDLGYEEEVRIVMPLKECRQENKDTGRLYLFDIPKRHISKIIVGWRTPMDKVAQLIRQVDLINPHVKVFQANIIKGRFDCGEIIYPQS